MEVEFLSNMRYNLVASKSEWDAWLDKLSCFREYYERALRLPASPLHIPSPSNNPLSSPLASPTGAAGPGMPDFSPSVQNIAMGTNLSPTANRTQNWSAYQANAVSPLAGKPAMHPGSARKRGTDEGQSDHPAKRFVPSSRMPPSATTGLPSQQQQPQQGARSLTTAPTLSLVTNPQPNLPSLPPAGQAGPYPQNSYVPPTAASGVPDHISLPPLQPGVRAMSTIFQPQQQPVPATSNAPGLGQTSFPGGAMPAQAPMGYGSGSGKSHSPGSLGPYASSPVPDQFGTASGIHTPMAHTPISNSPSFYLQQRNSPYRPIRHVNTLLYPPPSASLDQYHLSVPIQPTQMHYQPLGRRHDVRTGVVPEFLVYNRAQHPQMARQPGPQGHYHG